MNEASIGLTVRPLDGAPFGAEILGLDPGKIGEYQAELIQDTHRKCHGLLCFSFDRLLGPEELHALTAVFGENEFAPGLIDGLGKKAPEGQEPVPIEVQVAQIRARGDDPYIAHIGNHYCPVVL